MHRIISGKSQKWNIVVGDCCQVKRDCFLWNVRATRREIEQLSDYLLDDVKKGDIILVLDINEQGIMTILHGAKIGIINPLNVCVLNT